LGERGGSPQPGLCTKTRNQKKNKEGRKAGNRQSARFLLSCLPHLICFDGPSTFLCKAPSQDDGGKIPMADKLVEAEKNRDQAEKDFDDAEDVLQKAVKKCLAEKNNDKKMALLRHVVHVTHAAMNACEDLLSAEKELKKADKNGQK
jgi:hypothetical protein